MGLAALDCGRLPKTIVRFFLGSRLLPTPSEDGRDRWVHGWAKCQPTCARPFSTSRFSMPEPTRENRVLISRPIRSDAPAVCGVRLLVMNTLLTSGTFDEWIS